MLANWVKQGTSTTGTGAITLDGTPPAGYVAFKDVFVDGEVVLYVIEDGNNRELGIGKLTSGANWTLTRGFVFETLSGGTYTRASGLTSASPLSLSGNAVVTVDAATHSLGTFFRTFNAGATVPGILPANTVVDTTYGLTEQFSATDALVAWPARFNHFTTVSKAYVEVTTAAGTKMRIGIYTDGGGASFRPGKLLAETGDIDTSTTGVKSATLSATVFLRPGWYWLGFIADGDPTLRTFSGTTGDGCEFRGTTGVYGQNIHRGAYTTGWTSMPPDGASLSGWGGESAVKEIPAIWLVP